jgi:hypothetical protein
MGEALLTDPSGDGLVLVVYSLVTAFLGSEVEDPSVLYKYDISARRKRDVFIWE